MEEFNFNLWIPIFVLSAIGVIGAIYYKKVTTQYKIQAIKEDTKQKKKSESFEGAIGNILDTAPDNLKTIESEIATLEAQATKQGLTEQQKKELLGRLYSERDMLRYAVKYGHLVKPLGGTLGKVLEKIVGGIGN